MKLLAFLTALAVAQQTALDVVTSSPVHKTLAQLAGTLPAIVDVLRSGGPLTLFAPTDDAFAKLDEGTRNAVTSNSTLLAQVLQYHVIAGVAFDPTKAEPKSFPKTALGQALGVTVDAGRVTLQFGLGSSTVTGSVPTSNGVVHVVDTVLVPPPSASATAIAGKFNQLVAALQKVNLVGTVDGAKDITIFAPTDQAFQAFTEFATKNNIQVTDELLKRVLTLHVVPSVVYSTDIIKAKSVINTNALSNEPLAVQLKDGSVIVSGKGNTTPAKVALADVLFNKGVIHAIDTVLLPDLNQPSGVTPAPTRVSAALGAGLSLTALLSAALFAF
jgi:uncharacterized surface protein with fasciclin (FAS1) repeats